ncbi:MAG: hypothetical protein KAJ19_03685 [Gammaproteobacteria bacterium]|nr:hypothetical protein [Gammaproteobacteria bacterium]
MAVVGTAHNAALRLAEVIEMKKFLNVKDYSKFGLKQIDEIPDKYCIYYSGRWARVSDIDFWWMSFYWYLKDTCINTSWAIKRHDGLLIIGAFLKAAGVGYTTQGKYSICG